MLIVPGGGGQGRGRGGGGALAVSPRWKTQNLYKYGNSLGLRRSYSQ